MRTACRWGCRCWAGRSTRRRCSRWAPRWRRRRASRPMPAIRMEARTMSYTIEGATGPWEVVVGLEVHAQVDQQGEAVQRRGDRIRRRAEQPGQLRRRGVPRHAAGDQPRMRGAGGAHRAGAERRTSTWSAGSTARTISMPICPPAIRSASTQHPIVGTGVIEIELADGSIRSHRRHAPASGAGCRQVDARPASDASPSST